MHTGLFSSSLESSLIPFRLEYSHWTADVVGQLLRVLLSTEVDKCFNVWKCDDDVRSFDCVCNNWGDVCDEEHIRDFLLICCRWMARWAWWRLIIAKMRIYKIDISNNGMENEITTITRKRNVRIKSDRQLAIRKPRKIIKINLSKLYKRIKNLSSLLLWTHLDMESWKSKPQIQ